MPPAVTQHRYPLCRLSGRQGRPVAAVVALQPSHVSPRFQQTTGLPSSRILARLMAIRETSMCSMVLHVSGGTARKRGILLLTAKKSGKKDWACLGRHFQDDAEMMMIVTKTTAAVREALNRCLSLSSWEENVVCEITCVLLMGLCIMGQYWRRR